MTDRPYTDDDLRAEAAKQHKILTEDIDFMCVGEQMQGDEPWDSLGEDDFDTAQRAIDDLLTDAANVSAWAIDLGADGLRPDTERQLTFHAGEKPVARILLAFEPGATDEMRDALATGLADFLDGLRAALSTDADPGGVLHRLEDVCGLYRGIGEASQGRYETGAAGGGAGGGERRAA